MNVEKERINKYYEYRKISNGSSLYTYFNIGNLYMIHSREKKLLSILSKNGMQDIFNNKILDVGCGAGGMLRNFVQYGANPENLYGIDLIDERIAKAKKLNPNMNFVCDDASKLPYKNEYFDIIIQYTLFSTVIDSTIKNNIAKEMLRVLKKDGVIIWYDMRTSNPFNKNISSIGKKEIRSLFKECKCNFYSHTLNQIISKRLAKLSVVLCQLFEKLGVLNSHYFAVIKKGIL